MKELLIQDELEVILPCLLLQPQLYTDITSATYAVMSRMM